MNENMRSNEEFNGVTLLLRCKNVQKSEKYKKDTKQNLVKNHKQYNKN